MQEFSSVMGIWCAIKVYSIILGFIFKLSQNTQIQGNIKPRCNIPNDDRKEILWSKNNPKMYLKTWKARRGNTRECIRLEYNEEESEREREILLLKYIHILFWKTQVSMVSLFYVLMKRPLFIKFTDSFIYISPAKTFFKKASQQRTLCS